MVDDPKDADKQTAEMMDLFTDMIQRAPVKTVETLPEEALDDTPRVDINKAMDEILAKYPLESMGASGFISKPRPVPLVTREEYLAFKRQQVETDVINNLFDQSGQFSQHQKSVQAGWKDKRALTAILWILGGSWAQIGVASNRAKETCVAGGHRSFREHRLEGLQKVRTVKDSWLTQEQVSFLWKYGIVNQSLYLPELNFMKVLKALLDVQLPPKSD